MTRRVLQAVPSAWTAPTPFRHHTIKPTSQASPEGFSMLFLKPFHTNIITAAILRGIEALYYKTHCIKTYILEWHIHLFGLHSGRLFVKFRGARACPCEEGSEKSFRLRRQMTYVLFVVDYPLQD